MVHTKTRPQQTATSARPAWYERCTQPGYHRKLWLRRVLAALCLIMALVAGLLHRQQPTIEVAYYAKDIAAGHLLEATDVVRKQVPAATQAAELTVQPDEVVGSIVLQHRQAGSQVYAADVLQDQQLPEHPNLHLVPIQLADPTLSDVLLPGDRISLIQPGSAELALDAALAHTPLTLEVAADVLVVLSTHAQAGFTSGDQDKSAQHNAGRSLEPGTVIVGLERATAAQVASMSLDTQFAVIITDRAGSKTRG